MSKDNKPSHFYKYCPVYSRPEQIIECNEIDDLKVLGEYSLINLFKHQAKFSSRTDFNDLFDTRIDFIVPTKREIKSFLQQLSAKERSQAKQFFTKDIGQRNFRTYRERVNKQMDAYKMFCVTVNGSNNLMWSHYTNYHSGFCIEFDSSKLFAEKVLYLPELAKFKLLDIVKESYGLITEEQLGDLITEAMLTKLDEWEYEEEYRITASHEMDKTQLVQKEADFAIYRTNPDWVKAVIFGHRMDETVRRYIIEKYKNNVQYKVAVPDMRRGSIRIENYGD